MKPSFPLTLLLALLSGCAISTQLAPDTGSRTVKTTDPDTKVSINTSKVPGSATFTCQESTSGACYIHAFTSVCADSTNTSGKKRYVCEKTSFDEFMLRAGESKSFASPPEGLKECVGLNSFPALKDCS